MDNMRRYYETTFIVNSYLEDPQIEAIISKVEETITRNGGVIKVFDKIGRKRLAYPIKKKNNGYYCFILFESTSDIITKLERVYQLEENILRYLTIFLDKKDLSKRLQTYEKSNVEIRETPSEISESTHTKKNDKLNNVYNN